MKELRFCYLVPRVFFLVFSVQDDHPVTIGSGIVRFLVDIGDPVLQYGELYQDGSIQHWIASCIMNDGFIIDTLLSSDCSHYQ